MALPSITFKEFASNPITALLFICVFALGTLWYQNKIALENHISDYKQQVVELKKENAELRDKYFELLTELKEVKLK
jgi:hypothetical protein